MNRTFRFLTAFFLAWMPAAWASADPLDATFLSVAGEVSFTDSSGATVPASVDSKAPAGSRVTVGRGGKAVLGLFDGSTVELEPDTQFLVTSLRKPSEREKKIRFELLSGAVKAVVAKLMTAHSLFEIEAGGVVCGVRGTQFRVAYDPVPDRVNLRVMEGTVYAKAAGETYNFKAGEQGEFLKGRLVPRFGQDQASLKRARERLPQPPSAPSLSLADLNLQFTQSVMVNGTSALGAVPALGNSLRSDLRLGGDSLGILPIQLNLP